MMTVQHGTTTIPDLVARAAADHGEREAVVDGEQRLTFADLASRVRQAGRAMIAWGVRPGDRVAIWAPNSAEWIVTALGAVSVGAVLVPLNTRLKAAEVGYILRKSRTKLVAVAGRVPGRGLRGGAEGDPRRAAGPGDHDGLHRRRAAAGGVAPAVPGAGDEGAGVGVRRGGGIADP